MSRFSWCSLLQHLNESTSRSSRGDHTLPFGQFPNMSKTLSIKHALGKCSERTARHWRLFSTLDRDMWHVTCDRTQHTFSSRSAMCAYCADEDPSSNVEYPNQWRIDMPLHASRSAKLLRGIQFHCRGCGLSNKQSLMKGSKSEITERINHIRENWHKKTTRSYRLNQDSKLFSNSFLTP